MDYVGETMKAENLPDFSGYRPETSYFPVEKEVVRGSKANNRGRSGPFSDQTYSSDLLVYVSRLPLLGRNRLSNADIPTRTCAEQVITWFQSISPSFQVTL